MAIYKFANKGATTLSSSINSTTTSISVVDASVLPDISATGEFRAVFETIDRSQYEIVRVTAIIGNTLTVIRAQESTTGQVFSAGDYVQNRVTQATLDEFIQRTDDIVDGGTF